MKRCGTVKAVQKAVGSDKEQLTDWQIDLNATTILDFFSMH